MNGERGAYVKPEYETAFHVRGKHDNTDVDFLILTERSALCIQQRYSSGLRATI
jgi:hypothetical protein